MLVNAFTNVNEPYCKVLPLFLRFNFFYFKNINFW